jgi:ectoine hydroxylase-related dioxygenase (phytanoyl-CoA dioxygenase family)
MNNNLQFYGVKKQKEILSEENSIVEEISIQGYSIMENVIEEKELSIIRKKLDNLNSEQEQHFGRSNLESIQELDTVRCPFVNDDYFLKVAVNPKILKVVEKILGDYFILHLQNGVINKPSIKHHQSSWHRDLPYQEFVITKPLAISVFWCIDPFDSNTGGTVVLPFTHKIEYLPSLNYIEKYEKQINASPGSVLIFDSMLFHRAGYNRSGIIRRGINNMYSVPILKQQIDIPKALKGKFSDDPFLFKLLGYTSSVPENVDDFRKKRMIKQKIIKS